MCVFPSDVCVSSPFQGALFFGVKDTIKKALPLLVGHSHTHIKCIHTYTHIDAFTHTRTYNGASAAGRSFFVFFGGVKDPIKKALPLLVCLFLSFFVHLFS